MKQPVKIIKSVYSWEELANTNKEQVMENTIEQATVDTNSEIQSISTEQPSLRNESDFSETPKKDYPKNLIALNRLTRDGKAIVAAQGHSKNSFKRDYDNGTASYVCKTCNATLSVSAFSTEGIDGTVLNTKCTPAQTA